MKCWGVKLFHTVTLTWRAEAERADLCSVWARLEKGEAQGGSWISEFKIYEKHKF